MKLNDYDDNSNGRLSSGAAVLAALLIVSVVVIVLVANKDYLKRRFGSGSSVSESVSSVSFEDSVSSVYSASSEVFVSDLSFYKDYEARSTESTSDTETSESVTDTSTTASETEQLTEENDGKHTRITNLDGTTEWAVISPHIPKCDYDYTNLFNQSGRLKYFEDNKCTSFFGIDVSKEQNYIDYNKVKKDGVDFVMVRLGARGYQTGQLSVDDYFRDNVKRATDAGLAVGVYFMSQAVTEDEAREEAKYVIDNLLGYNITYPVAIMMQPVKNDTARTDALSKNDRTTVVRAFLKEIKDKGYIPVIYGTKRWFLKDIDLSKVVGDYDIWLSETGADYPDYPYRYSMWQYDLKGSVDGVSGDVDFNISFVDYSLK